MQIFDVVFETTESDFNLQTKWKTSQLLSACKRTFVTLQWMFSLCTDFPTALGNRRCYDITQEIPLSQNVSYQKKKRFAQARYHSRATHKLLSKHGEEKLFLSTARFWSQSKYNVVYVEWKWLERVKFLCDHHPKWVISHRLLSGALFFLSRV